MMKQKGRAAVVGFIHFHMAIDFAAKPDVLLHTSDTRFVEPPVIADGVSGKAKYRRPDSFQNESSKTEPSSYELII
ncbi:PHD finger protein ALFIN-LIKE [Dirofilaria immitis]